MTGYFDESFKSMVSFFMKKNDINTVELDEISKMIEDKKKIMISLKKPLQKKM